MKQKKHTLPEEAINLYTQIDDKFFLLGIGFEGKDQPEIYCRMNYKEAQDLLVDLCAFILNVDIETIRQYTKKIRLELACEHQNEPNGTPNENLQ